MKKLESNSKDHGSGTWILWQKRKRNPALIGCNINLYFSLDLLVNIKYINTLHVSGHTISMKINLFIFPNKCCDTKMNLLEWILDVFYYWGRKQGKYT